MYFHIRTVMFAFFVEKFLNCIISLKMKIEVAKSAHECIEGQELNFTQKIVLEFKLANEQSFISKFQNLGKFPSLNNKHRKNWELAMFRSITCSEIKCFSLQFFLRKKKKFFEQSQTIKQ